MLRANTQQGTKNTASCLPSRKLSKLDEPDMQGHCWKSRDELISDVLLWTPTYCRAKAGRPARTDIQQLCEDTGCSPEDLPEGMNDKEKVAERGSGISVLAARHDDDDEVSCGTKPHMWDTQGKSGPLPTMVF